MRISDDKRREVAAKMRKTCRENPDVSLQGMVASTMNECLPEGMEYGPTLADLIDRPTCEMTECSIDNGSRSWGMSCSRCGTEFEHEKPVYGWRYCPNCGAEVVGE